MTTASIIAVARVPRRGFLKNHSLVEMLSVVVLIVALLAVTWVAVGSITRQSVVAACTSKAQVVETAVVAFQATNGIAMPVSQHALLAGGTARPYLSAWPSDPAHYAISVSADGNVYVTPTGSGQAMLFGPSASSASHACEGVG